MGIYASDGRKKKPTGLTTLRMRDHFSQLIIISILPNIREIISLRPRHRTLRHTLLVEIVVMIVPSTVMPDQFLASG